MKALLLMTMLVTAGCDPDDGDPKPEPLYPADWETRFVKLRECRSSPDHDLEYVSLWSDSASAARYTTCVKPDGACTGAFDEGAVFLKPQYADARCSDLVRISAVKKDATFTTVGGWQWQEVMVDGGKATVTEDGAITSCYGCHRSSACESAFDTRCYMDEP